MAADSVIKHEACQRIGGLFLSIGLTQFLRLPVVMPESLFLPPMQKIPSDVSPPLPVING
ncbi:MAG: hypothetical protein PHO83_18030 [Geobacteraceae bacterium]|nr:hypothetical protein [Geobacteraceae bacterium]